MSKEQNLETTKKLGEAVSTGNLEALKGIFSADVIEHDPAPGQGKARRLAGMPQAQRRSTVRRSQSPLARP